MTTKYKITASTELMDNYKQSEVISPQKKFRAVQTDRGLALLFSIGTDGIFYLIEQRTDHKTGWERIDLSSGLSSVHNNGPVVAKTFAVAQNFKTQKIDLALVITVDGEDFLYLSLGNDNTAGMITVDTVSWTLAPFDDPQHAGISLDVVDVFIAESRFEEYIVVDISQSTFKTDPTNYLSRYYIDTSASQKWNSMTIGGELEPGASSCLGRVDGDRVDGMYTLGTIGGTTELLYAPLYNAFDRQAPVTIRRLTMPQGATVIAASDAGNDATNLFVAAADGLYYFASDNQEDSATGVRMVSNDLFNGATTLYAIAADNQVTVWGLNGRTDKIFYTSCPAGELTTPTAWSVPVPIMTGVEQVAPYVNRGNSANTFFAHTGTGEMTVGVKSPQTTIWNRRSVTLPPSNTKVKATKFRSYTTRIQVVDENDQPVSGAAVNISSDSDTSVYINHLYHLVGTTPVQVETDTLGTITVVDVVSTLAGAQLHVSLVDGTKTSINPMAKPSADATKLQSASDLSNAVITYQNGDTKKLVKEGVDSKTLDAVANANIQLAAAYQQVGSGGTGGGVTRISKQTLAKSAAASGQESIWVEAGDLFSWLEHEIEHVGELIWNETKQAWTFVVKIADEIYSAVLDCVEAVVSAIQTVYNAIVKAIEDLIDFLKYLFELDDIERTKNVIENIAKLFLQHQVDQIEVIKKEFNGMIDDAEKAINNWAGRGDLDGLGTEGTTPINQSSKPANNNSAPGALLSYHYQHNARNATMSVAPPSPSQPGNPVSVLIKALEDEWDTLGDAFGAIYELVGDIGSMSAEDLVKQLIAIIADTTLESVKIVVDALLDVIYDMAESALKVFETPIHIPVVSDILEDFGVPEFSFLDIACWVGAVPVTIAYKLAKGKAPFDDNAETKTLTNATSFTSLAAQFPGSPPVTHVAQKSVPMLVADGTSGDSGLMAADAGDKDGGGLIPISESTANVVFILGHALAGVSGMFSAGLDSMEAAEESGDNPLVIPAAVSAILGGGLQVGANFLVPKNPIDNTALVVVYDYICALRVVSKAIFSGPGQKFLGGKPNLKELKVENARGLGAVVDAVLVFPALACSCYHFFELAEAHSSSTRTEAILDESSNIAAYFARVSYAVAVNTEAEVKIAAIAVLAVSDLAYCGLQIAESVT